MVVESEVTVAKRREGKKPHHKGEGEGEGELFFYLDKGWVWFGLVSIYWGPKIKYRADSRLGNFLDRQPKQAIPKHVEPNQLN